MCARVRMFASICVHVRACVHVCVCVACACRVNACNFASAPAWLLASLQEVHELRGALATLESEVVAAGHPTEEGVSDDSRRAAEAAFKVRVCVRVCVCVCACVCACVRVCACACVCRG